MTKSSDANTVAPPVPDPLAVPMTARLRMAAVDQLQQLAYRVRHEYLEMPGLSLTLAQAQRMWHLRQNECEELFSALIEAGFLARTTRGTFVRADTGRASA